MDYIKNSKIWLTSAIVLLALPIGAYLFLGLTNRPIADDFCFTNTARSYGLLDTVAWYYNDWTGTYSSTFFQGLIGLTHSWHLTPVVLITLFTSASIWVAAQWVKTFKLPQSWHVAGILGLLFAFGVITGTANVFQSFYWTSGGVTYTGPLIIFLFHLGLLLYLHRQPRLRSVHVILIAGTMLLSGGFSPLVGIFQITFFVFMTLLVWRFSPDAKKRHDLMLTGFSLLFIVIAFVLVFIAPGNAARQASFVNTMALSEIMIRTGLETVRFLATATIFLSPVPILVSLLLSGILAFHYHPLTSAERYNFSKFTLQLLGLSAFIGIMTIASSFFTTLYSIGELPPARAYVTMQTVLVLTSMCWGYLMGLGLRLKHQPTGLSLRTSVLIIVLVGGGALYTLNRPISLGSTFQHFAQIWDDNDTLLRSMETNQPQFELEDFTKGFTSYYWLRDPLLPCIREYYQQPNLTFPTSEITFFQ